MDVYEGRFRANGGCGYLLKPAVMREHISVFSAHSRETIPGVAPQLLKIKVRKWKGGVEGERESDRRVKRGRDECTAQKQERRGGEDRVGQGWRNGG